MKLKGKVAIVTGANSGIGESLSRIYAEQGANVVGVARRAEKLEAVAKSCAGLPGSFTARQGDVTKLEDLEAVVSYVIEQYGKIDILVNNAGRSDDFSGAADMTEEMWDAVINLNLNSVFRFCKIVLPHMIAAGSGTIINIASVAGVEFARGGVAYTVSKHGVVALTKHTAFQYAEKGIRCNAICPGTIVTPLVMGIDEKKVNPEGYAKCISGSQNAPRMGQPAEIGNIALFLASDDASLLNGAVLVADAGWTCY